MIGNSIRKFMAALAILSLFLLTGCNKLSTDNYNKLKTGMDYERVVEILGDADNCEEALGAKSCTWGSDAKFIKVKFLGNKAAFMSHKGL